MNSTNYYDYTGLVSGHKRSLKVERAYDEMIDAWAAYNMYCDRIEDGENIPQETLAQLRQIAMRKDGEYARIHDEWTQSY